MRSPLILRAIFHDGLEADLGDDRTVIDSPLISREQVAQASQDPMRQMHTTFINTVLSAEIDAFCRAVDGRVSEAGSAHGCGHRDLDTRVGTVDVAAPSSPIGLVHLCDVGVVAKAHPLAVGLLDAGADQEATDPLLERLRRGQFVGRGSSCRNTQATSTQNQRRFSHATVDLAGQGDVAQTLRVRRSRRKFRGSSTARGPRWSGCSGDTPSQRAASSSRPHDSPPSPPSVRSRRRPRRTGRRHFVAACSTP